MNSKYSSYKNAYGLFGHAREGDGYYIVPPGCAVVVSAHSGELSYISDNIFKDLLTLPKETLLNPEEYYSILVDKLVSKSAPNKSLAIYKEGA